MELSRANAKFVSSPRRPITEEEYFSIVNRPTLLPQLMRKVPSLNWGCVFERLMNEGRVALARGLVQGLDGASPRRLASGVLSADAASVLAAGLPAMVEADGWEEDWEVSGSGLEALVRCVFTEEKMQCDKSLHVRLADFVLS
jgi:hypothetical protein